MRSLPLEIHLELPQTLDCKKKVIVVHRCVISFQGTASRTSLFGPGLPISDTSRSRPQTFYLQQCQIQLVSARVVQYMMLCLEELAYEIADVRTSQAMQNEMTDFQVMLPMLLHLSV